MIANNLPIGQRRRVVIRPDGGGERAGNLASPRKAASALVVDDRHSHPLEDFLLATAIAAFGLDDRITPDLLCDVAKILLQARKKGRTRELFGCAQREAEALPVWQCRLCDEPNPATFDLCWNCSNMRPSDTTGLSLRSEALLAAHAVVECGIAAKYQEKAARCRNDACQS
jgi:hypothetical protein